jgi:hypothetical protein
MKRFLSPIFALLVLCTACGTKQEQIPYQMPEITAQIETTVTVSTKSAAEIIGEKTTQQAVSTEELPKEPTVIDLKNLETANSNAKLLFQNAGTYISKCQIYAINLYSGVYSGDLNEKIEKSPKEIPDQSNPNWSRDELSVDLDSALKYYMGGEDNGVYALALDEEAIP